MSKRGAHKDFQDELKYHQREWLVERIGWLVLLGLIIAALLGVFGGGPISDKSVGDARTATLKYERFIRYAAPTTLELTVAKGQPGPMAVEVNEAYLRDFEITSIVPTPHSVALVGERYRFEFDLKSAPATISIRIEPERFGSKHGAFVVGGTRLDFAQFVYP